jgi:hypothetical protein
MPRVVYVGTRNSYDDIPLNVGGSWYVSSFGTAVMVHEKEI